MNGKKGSLLMTELMITLAVFLVCAAVSLSMFVSAKKASLASEKLGAGSMLAENAAECFKSTGGSAELTAKLLSAKLLGDTLTSHYDRDMNTAAGGGYYELTMKITGGELRTADITVICDGESVFSLAASCIAGVENG